MLRREVFRLKDLKYHPGMKRRAEYPLSSEQLNPDMNCLTPDEILQHERLLERTQASVLNWLGLLSRNQGKG